MGHGAGMPASGLGGAASGSATAASGIPLTIGEASGPGMRLFFESPLQATSSATTPVANFIFPGSCDPHATPNSTTRESFFRLNARSIECLPGIDVQSRKVVPLGRGASKYRAQGDLHGAFPRAFAVRSTRSFEGG